MTRIKKLCSLILVLMLVITAGVLTTNAAVTADENTAADSTTNGITIHYRSKTVTEPYVYLWNSLPTNDAMSKSYPGEKMTSANGWYNYYVEGVSKVNAIITDASGEQHSAEQKLNSSEWWCDDGKWTKYNPDDLDDVTDIDMREESIYFVITTRFYDGDTGNNVHCWDDSQANNPDSDPAWRGDFKGLADKLDYIKALGFSAIWVTPVVTNASGYDYHGYHAMDFATVDKRYESEDFTYEDLIRAIHAKDMKIVQDVVYNHTGNFGEASFCNLFEKDYSADLSDLEASMVPTQLLLDTYGLKSAEEYYAQVPSVQYQQRLNLMKNVNITGNNSTGTYPSSVDYDIGKLSNSDIYNANNAYHTGYFQSLNWDDWTCKDCQIAGDCVDLNTENPAVAQYTVDSYSKYIDMGVDSFRLDTARHISRLSLNMMYNQQILDAAKAANKNGFYVFGEICCRYSQTWYRDHACESVPFYTWAESDDKWASSWNSGSSAEEINDNMNLTYDHYIEYDDTSKQPTSDNAFLDGLNYHTPDHSQSSGIGAIDFTMHWNFDSAKGAYGSALSGDKYFNDSTYNVMYVQSHDYSSDNCQNVGYTGGTQAWAENMNLMFTFRGIPCLYYGNEVEFGKGNVIDKGPNLPLSETCRAYYGDYIEGDVTTTDFGDYKASGTVAETLNSPLCQQLTKLNKMRRAIPALQKGQYTTDSKYVSGGNMAYVRRYTDAASNVDSLACVAISGGATFTNLPNGTYIDAVTGDVQNVSNGTLTVPSIGTANMRVYVCCASGFTGITGQIGGTTAYLK